MKAHVKLQNVVSLKTKRTEKDDTPIKTDVLIIAADIRGVDGLHHIVLQVASLHQVSVFWALASLEPSIPVCHNS